MHYRMLVTVFLKDGATSEEARCHVQEALITDDSFCGSGGRFGSPLSDWFVIGGRWSGLLAETIRADAYRIALLERFPEMSQGFWPESLVDQHQQELDTLWQQHGGTGPSPYTRSSYDELGYPDDAQLLTTALYDALLEDYIGKSLVVQDGYCEFVDLDDEPLSPDMIGRKWLIVIDYHN